MDIDFFNELLGVDITAETKQREYVRARQGVWTMLRCAMWSYKDIGNLFGYHRQSVSEGCDSFEKDLKQDKDNISKRYWKLLNPLIEKYAK